MTVIIIHCISVSDVVLVFLLFILTPFSSVSTVSLEQVNDSWDVVFENIIISHLQSLFNFYGKTLFFGENSTYIPNWSVCFRFLLNIILLNMQFNYLKVSNSIKKVTSNMASYFVFTRALLNAFILFHS